MNTNSSVKIIMVEVQEEKQQSCNIDTTGVCEIMNLVTARYDKVPDCKQKYLSEGRQCSGSKAGALLSKNHLVKDL